MLTHTSHRGSYTNKPTTHHLLALAEGAPGLANQIPSPLPPLATPPALPLLTLSFHISHERCSRLLSPQKGGKFEQRQTRSFFKLQLLQCENTPSLSPDLSRWITWSNYVAAQTNVNTQKLHYNHPCTAEMHTCTNSNLLSAEREKQFFITRCHWK